MAEAVGSERSTDSLPCCPERGRVLWPMPGDQVSRAVKAGV